MRTTSPPLPVPSNAQNRAPPLPDLVLFLFENNTREIGIGRATERKPKMCISRESNPGHIDGNDVFYH